MVEIRGVGGRRRWGRRSVSDYVSSLLTFLTDLLGRKSRQLPGSQHPKAPPESSFPRSLTKVRGMDVEPVRSFNRTVAERIGALQDTYLELGRPLGANRVLWEIGDGTDLRTLRATLGLDSGYLSRLIAALQREGLVETAPGDDKRVRAVALTDAGRAEREVLDQQERPARARPARAAQRQAARAADRGDGDRRAAADRGPGRDRRRGPAEPGRAVLPARVLQGARRALRRRVRRHDELCRPTTPPSSSPACAASPSAAARSGSRDSYIKRMWVAPAGARARPRAADPGRARERSTNGLARLETTARCRRRSTSTARRATSRSSPSTTSPTPTTGSRSAL